MVFKAVSHGKTYRSAAQLLHYITEGSEHLREPEKAVDQDGREWEPGQVQEAFAEWSFKRDADNLSKTAREATPAERAEMKEADRYGERQVSHWVISFPPGTEITRDQMKGITEEALKPYADDGHRHLYAFHMDAKNPHVHVIMANRNDEGRRLHFERADPELFRQRVAEIARAHGVDVEATRQPWRENERKRQAPPPERHTKTTHQARHVTELERLVPGWHDRHGARVEQERTGVEARTKAPEPPHVSLPPLLTKAEAVLDREMASRYHDDGAAKQRFLEMAAENKKLAFWYVNNKPQVFGQVKADAPKTPLAERQIPLKPEWREAAHAALRKASATEPAQSRAARAQVREAARRVEPRSAPTPTEPRSKPPEPISAMSTKDLQARPIKELCELASTRADFERIAEARNYKPSWTDHAVRDKTAAVTTPKPSIEQRARTEKQEHEKMVKKDRPPRLVDRIRDLLKRTGAGAHDRPDPARTDQAPGQSSAQPGANTQPVNQQDLQQRMKQLDHRNRDIGPGRGGFGHDR